jgi:hypothetical protein
MNNTYRTKEQITDITEYYETKLKIRYFRKLQKYLDITEKEKGNYYRKRLIFKILRNNINEIKVKYYIYIAKIYNNRKVYFYRVLHLKKYYIKRWKRTIYILKNIKIARLKFISKFILIWRKSILHSNQNRLESAYKLEHILDYIKNKKVISYINVLF